ncbi:membrane protein (plasmid) [Deinococcus aetherius]|uniref:Membrane protein n=1 Tax=Deinococcus aetherius TaxID=200252 RepID=A0ABM8AJ60_9DEIO|nr:membrane protein [Deinococcus aetherius]
MLLAVGGFLLRYGVVLLLVVYGLAKWTRAEALAIQPLVEHSPLTSWLYQLTSVQRGSEALGVVELSTATLMALRPLSPRLSAVGSLLAAGMFLVTLSFLVTTPGIDPGTGGFLTKDLILLGASLWTAGEALRAVRTASPRARRRAGLV